MFLYFQFSMHLLTTFCFVLRHTHTKRRPSFFEGSCDNCRRSRVVRRRPLSTNFFFFKPVKIKIEKLLVLDKDINIVLFMLN